MLQSNKRLLEVSRCYCNNEWVTWIEYHPKNTKRQNIYKWKVNFTVTHRKNGQMRFFMTSAVKKWPNFSNLAIKWPILQPWSCFKHLGKVSQTFPATLFSVDARQRWARTGLDQDRSQFWPDKTGSDCNSFESWWIGLRKVLLFWCDYSENIKNFGCDPISQVW